MSTPAIASAPTRTCPRCGQMVKVTPSRHLRAHPCPHGGVCVPSYAARRTGARGDPCALCTPAERDEYDGQLPMPFARGIRPKLRRPAPKRSRERFAWARGQWGHTCPVCGCGASGRCTVTLEDGSIASCVPAGVLGLKVCSGCKQPGLPGVT